MHFGYTAIKTTLSSFILSIYLTSLAWGGVVVFIDDTPATSTAEVLWGGEANAISDANCVGAWYMNSAGSTNETDRSGNSETLTADTFVAGSATVPSGYSGASRDWERGDNDHMKHADGGSTDLSGTAMSIACWVRIESFNSSDGSWNAIATKYSGTNDRTFFLNAVTGTSTSVGELSIRFYNSSDTSSILSSTSNGISTATWYHVAATYDGSSTKLYVDGTEVASGSLSGNLDNSTSEFVVGGINSHSYFDGLIDELIIFDRAITASEVQDLIDNGISGNTGGND